MKKSVDTIEVKKQHDKKKSKEIYDHFWIMYDEARISISKIMIDRIKQKHYKYVTMNPLTSLMEFLLGLYPESQFHFKVYYRMNGLYIGVYDTNDNRFVEYGWKSGKPRIIKDVTDFSQNFLKSIGVYNESIHAVRKNPIVVIE